MKLLPQDQVHYICCVVLVLVLSHVANCVEDSIDLIVKQKSEPLVVPTNSTNPYTTGGNGTRHDEIEPITKTQLSTERSPADLPLPDKTTSKVNLSHDNIPSNTGLSEHSINTTILPETQQTINTTTPSATNFSSTATNGSFFTAENHSTLVVPTVPIHRKSKPEETSVDKIVRDSGPTTDYVVPLVIAMLAVPLVGVLCALLYMKGRDFWERRHYGRIDFLWDSRNDSRMDFLIDGMYNN